MRIDKKYRIEKAASSDPTREILNSVSLEGDKLIATTGKIIAVIPIQNDDGGKDTIVPISAIAAARKGAAKEMHLALDTSGDRVKVMLTKNGGDV